jgi:RNA polymerase-binding transcription factor DksA
MWPVTDASEPSGPDGNLVERLGEQLAAEQDQLVSQIHDLDGTGPGQGFDEGFADTAQVSAEQSESRVLAAELREQLDNVEAAIARIADGTYGTCVVCSQPIAADRLEAMPATRWCIEHAGG